MSIRVLIALAAVLDWEVLQLDVKTVFLYPARHDKIFMELPEGHEDHEGRMVSQLQKSMYGLNKLRGLAMQILMNT